MENEPPLARDLIILANHRCYPHRGERWRLPAPRGKPSLPTWRAMQRRILRTRDAQSNSESSSHAGTAIAR